MAAVDEIKTINPTWRIGRKKEKDTNDGKNKKPPKKPPDSQENQKPDDGRPHIDEYA